MWPSDCISVCIRVKFSIITELSCVVIENTAPVGKKWIVNNNFMQSVCVVSWWPETLSSIVLAFHDVSWHHLHYEHRHKTHDARLTLANFRFMLWHIRLLLTPPRWRSPFELEHDTPQTFQTRFRMGDVASCQQRKRASMASAAAYTTHHRTFRICINNEHNYREGTAEMHAPRPHTGDDDDGKRFIAMQCVTIYYYSIYGVYTFSVGHDFPRVAREVRLTFACA